MAKVKVFVYAANTDADADGRAMTLAPRTFFPARWKRCHSSGNLIKVYIHRYSMQGINSVFINMTQTQEAQYGPLSIAWVQWALLI